DVLGSGESVNVTIADGRRDREYDLKIVFDHGDRLEDTTAICDTGSSTIPHRLQTYLLCSPRHLPGLCFSACCYQRTAGACEDALCQFEREKTLTLIRSRHRQRRSTGCRKAEAAIVTRIADQQDRFVPKTCGFRDGMLHQRGPDSARLQGR